MLRDKLLESPSDLVPTTDTQTTTVIGRRITITTKTTGAMMPTVAITTTGGERTTAATTISAEGTTIAAVITTAEMTITAVTMTTTGRMTIVGTTIATTGNHETPKGTTDRKMSARSDGALRTTINEDLDPQGPNHNDHRNNKSGNWYP